MSVIIETTVGDITVDLYLKERPNTCLNFLKLCKIKYYNLSLFHKVERNFIAQTGDPTSTGRGGESIFAHLYGDQAKYFDSELKPKLKHEKIGTLSMVNNGNNMNGSQFFLTLGENLTYLDEVHTVFGEVAEGFEILLKINETICDTNNRPYQDIRITHTVVLHDPYDDPNGLSIPDGSPVPTKEMLATDYIAADEEIDDTKGKNVEEIEEKIKESEAKARATILEMVGDIPDADVKPPENVLFVCKLNPVTTSEDLELIFSRFGTIVSCEVIKDKKSGESLQYAFIEFEKEEDCENAYFKMDNVLIDDRRIHVDFSQSVSKLNWNPDNRFLKQKSSKSETYIIKNKDRKSDGYEMIFDMDVESDSSKSKKKDRLKERSSESKRTFKTSSNSQSHKSRKRSNSPDNKSYYYSSSRDKKHRSKYAKSPSPEKSSKKFEKLKSRSSLRQEYSSKSSGHKNVKQSQYHYSSSSDSSSSLVNRKQVEFHSKDPYDKKSRKYDSQNSHSISKRNYSSSKSVSRKSRDSEYHSKPSSKSFTSSEHRKQYATSSSSESRSVSPNTQHKKERRKDSNYSTSSTYQEKRSSREHSKSVALHHRRKSSSSSESVSSECHRRNKPIQSSKNSDNSKLSVTSHHRHESSSSSTSVSSERDYRKKPTESSKPSQSYKKTKHQSFPPERTKHITKVSYSSHIKSTHKEKYTNSYSNESDEESYYTSKKPSSSKSSSLKHSYKRSRNRRSSS